MLKDYRQGRRVRRQKNEMFGRGEGEEFRLWVILKGCWLILMDILKGGEGIEYLALGLGSAICFLLGGFEDMYCFSRSGFGPIAVCQDVFDKAGVGFPVLVFLIEG